MSSTGTTRRISKRPLNNDDSIPPHKNQRTNDLASAAQVNVVDTKVNFQGERIQLNELITLKEFDVKYLPTHGLVRGEITVGKPIPIPHGYDELLFVERQITYPTLDQKFQVNCRSDKFPDKVYINSDAQNNPSKAFRNQHWLQDHQGKLVWQQSSAITRNLRKYLTTDPTLVFTTNNSDDFLQATKNHKFVLISAPAGMGKSTILTHFSHKVKAKCPEKWVLRFNLYDYDFTGTQFGSDDDTIEFLCERIIQLETWEKCIFKKLLNAGQVVIMMDGFYESTSYHDTEVLKMIQALQSTKISQIWLTTRPHLVEDLEVQFNQLSFSLEPFTDSQRLEFLKKYWMKLSLVTASVDTTTLNNFCSRKTRETGGPIQTLLWAEIYHKEIEESCELVEMCEHDDMESGLPLCLSDLYATFIQTKLRNGSTMQLRSQSMDLHETLAIKCLFEKTQFWSILQTKVNIRKISLPNQIAKWGLVRYHDDEPRFIHRTFTEYFAACFIEKGLLKYSSDPEWCSFIIIDILIKAQYSVVRKFLEGLLQYKESCFVGIASQMFNIESLNIATEERNNNILKFILSSLKNTFRRILPGFMICTSKNNNAWINSIQTRNLEAVQELWGCLSVHDQEALLKRGTYGQTWHLVAENDCPTILRFLWERSKELLGSEGSAKLLFETKREVFFLAVLHQSIETLQHLCNIANQSTSLSQERKSKLLLLPYKIRGQALTPWHLAVDYGSIEMVKILWQLVESDYSKEKLLMSKTTRHGLKMGWYFAAKKFHVDILEFLWEKYPGDTVAYKPQATLREIWLLGVERQNYELVVSCWNYITCWTMRNFDCMVKSSRGCPVLGNLLEQVKTGCRECRKENIL